MSPFQLGLFCSAAVGRSLPCAVREALLTAQEGIAHVPGLDFGVGAGSSQRLDKLHQGVMGFPLQLR